MSRTSIVQKVFKNGLRVVCEPMADVSSAAVVFSFPSGVVYDPAGRSGMAGVLSELLYRGAGPYDNQTLNDRFDLLGLHRNSSVNTISLSLSGAMVSDQLPNAVKLFGLVLRDPALDADQMEYCKLLSIQNIDSLEDDPRQKISILARSQFLSSPYDQSSYGRKSDIEQLTHPELIEHYRRQISPDGGVIAVAGDIDPQAVFGIMEDQFGNWFVPKVAPVPMPQTHSRVFHEENDGNQVHIAVYYPSVHTSHPDYYRALLSVSILSGGMGSRLFTEVREKRGLCYAVSASHTVIGQQGAVFCYAGSSPGQAQEALDVMMNELLRLADGVTEEELRRARIGLRASLVMQGESTSARASGCASDLYHLGRVRSLEEIEQAIMSVTVDELNGYVKTYPPVGFTVATLGPSRLKADRYIASR